MTKGQAFIKRLGDMLLSFGGLVLLSPFLFVIAVLIRLEDGGAAIFRQERITRGGRIFRIRGISGTAGGRARDEDRRLSSENLAG